MKWLYSGYAVVLSIALLLALRVVDPTPLQSLRGQVFDSYQQLDEIKESDNVVLINIGEKSLAKYGQYPFPRQYYAQMVVDVAMKNGGVMGWTIMFPEEDRFQGDESFAGMMQQNVMNVPGARKNPVNYNVLSQTPSVKGIKTTGPHIGTGTIGPVPAKDYLLTWPNLVTNIPILEVVANGKGVNASAPQPDNQTRTYPLAITVGNKIYPSFAVEMLRVHTGKPSYIIKTSEIGIQEVAVPPFDPIVTQSDGTAYIRFNNSFEEIEYEGADSIPDLMGKWVIVGVTAEGVANPVPTPRGNLYPQQIQAHMLQNFIDGSNITRSQLSAVYELLCGLLTMILIGFVVYRAPIWAGLLTTVSILGGIAYYSVHSYTANLVLQKGIFHQYIPKSDGYPYYDQIPQEIGFITEKTLKPIMYGHPFLLITHPGTLRHLRSIGFETFPEWFDEAYDEIELDDERFKSIKKQVTHIANTTLHIEAIKDKLEHNRQLFFNAKTCAGIYDKLIDDILK